MLSDHLVSLIPLPTKWTSHVLVYHATFQNTPENLHDGLHNVTPEVLYRQLSWIKSHFDIVRIDDLFLTRNIRGKAAITIDDGYASFFKEGFPVIKSLNIPCTMFLCGSTMEGKVFWRDKVRFLINNHLLRAFLDFLSERGISHYGLMEDNFYKRSKSPQINSHFLNTLMDDFFAKRRITFDNLRFCVTRREDLIRDPLIHYGNHSFDHYVLSSLSEEQQENQISRNHELVNRCGTETSKVFSVPFGGDDDFNDATVSILKKLGYIGFLLASGKINTRLAKMDSFACLNRYLPADNFPLFKARVKRMAVKQLIGLI